MSQQPELGARVKAMRLSRGLRQTDLAGDKVTVAYVSMVEAGKRTPGLEVLGHLAARLGCSIEELQGGPTAETRAGWRLRVDYAEIALHNGEPREALRAVEGVLPLLSGAASGAEDAELGWRAGWVRARALESVGDLRSAATAFAGLHAMVSPGGADPVAVDSAKAMLVAVAWGRCRTQLGDVTGALELVVAARGDAASAGLDGTDGYAELTSTQMSLLYMLNDIAAAASVSEELISLVERTGTRRARAAAYWNAAGVAEAQGDLAAAVAMSERAVVLLGEDDDDRMLARAKTACAWFMLRGDGDRAEEALGLLLQARSVFEEAGSVTDLAYTRVEAGQALLILGRAPEALIEAQAAVDAVGEQVQAESASAWLVRAAALTALGATDEARVSAARAESCLRELPVTRWTALGFRELGQVHEALGDATLAMSAYRAALDLSANTAPPSGEAITDSRSRQRARD
ncbi:MAG: helix-turn-helix transcriptional regulator [Actinomycetes bacterium]